MPSKFYVVAKGRKQGIFNSWTECENQVKKFKGAIYKSFPTMEEAKRYYSTQLAKLQQSESINDNDNNNLLLNSEELLSSELLNNNKKRNKQIEILDDDDEDNNNNLKKQKQSSSSLINNNEDNNDSIINYKKVYTDGSCLGNGNKNSIAGIGIYFGDNDPLNHYEALEVGDGLLASNQKAEIKAATRALEIIPKDVEYIEILTDSKYVINAMTDWRFSWQENNWRTKKDNKPVQNEELFKELINEIEKRKEVKFSYVAGHSNIHGNEMADQLAKKGAMLLLNKKM
ncbi:hypothetical protein ABK040_003906 [Willaertia magna]